MTDSNFAETGAVPVAEYERRLGLWIDALESGEFTQATGCLQLVEDLGGGHCCLGVACEVHRRETELGDWDPEYSAEEGRVAYVLEEGDGCVARETELPDAVRLYFGLRTDSGNLDPTDQLKVADVLGSSADHMVLNSLVAINDSDEVDFAGIAKILRTKPSSLFSWAGKGEQSDE